MSCEITKKGLYAGIAKLFRYFFMVSEAGWRKSLGNYLQHAIFGVMSRPDLIQFGGSKT